ncbi:WecB/TagA/CpsF family glycosyltransferase [Thiorhodovibrio litoralis]|uniref:WecB/TagA/CpsF family glycosyltransferase n=1 Tax=Thiorhodovibrio litoralis TaxID=2952932 RepID=UPI002B2608B1|nr:WecB/TagA/CpsF family glycosyltransferase [Thiorhodovibrio litoralis]WPL10858.1 Putative N-acetylmannosaminyltransferase [Thiorhodovibrio litoralis]
MTTPKLPHKKPRGLTQNDQVSGEIRPSSRLLGYDISARGLHGDVRLAFDMLNEKTRVDVVDCINPHSIVVAKHDDEFRLALTRASLLLPDGAGIILGAKMLGLPIRERVAGTEFFLHLSQLADKSENLRYFFLGSTPGVLNAIAHKLAKDFTNISVCGTYSPPFKQTFSQEENRKMAQMINEAKPDVLWVGMTAPKQEKWIENHRQVLQVPLICAIGAVFDFYGGSKKRSPEWIRKLGLEWLPRLLREPRRLWRRNLISTPVYLKYILMEIIGTQKKA